MVNRTERCEKSATWRLYFRQSHHTQKWKGILRKVVESGKARVIFRELSNLKVHLVWPREVTFQSAAKLVKRAKEQDSLFEILGHPRRVEDDDDDDGAEAALEKNKKSEVVPLAVRSHVTIVGKLLHASHRLYFLQEHGLYFCDVCGVYGVKAPRLLTCACPRALRPGYKSIRDRLRLGLRLGLRLCRRSAMVCDCISHCQPRIHSFPRGLHQPL